MSKNSIILDPSKVLSLSERDKLQIAATYQQLFHENNGELPTLELVYEAFGGIYSESMITEYIGSEPFQKKLKSWGLIKESPVVGLLSPEQVMIANMQLSLMDRRSLRQKLDDYNKNMETLNGDQSGNITVSQVESWQRDPAYRAYLQKRAKILYEDLETQATQNLARLIASGDLAATKLLYELKGKLNKTINMNVNVESVMVRVVEIIARHVEDKPTLDAIAKDIEELGTGNA